MSRSLNQFRHTRGGDVLGEYGSARLAGYPPAGRFTKTLTHRVERRNAQRIIEEALEEYLEETLPEPAVPMEEWTDLSSNLKVQDKLLVKEGCIRVGPVVLTAPTFGYHVMRSQRRVFELPTVLCRGNEPHAYESRSASRALCERLGPGFERRYRYAHQIAFERPLIAIMGKPLFRQFCMTWPEGKLHQYHYTWAWEHRELLARMAKDGYIHLLPVFYAMHVNEYGVHRRSVPTQPVQAMRKQFSKSEWKQLCAQPLSRLVLLGHVVTRYRYLMLLPNEQLQQAVSHLVNLPTTLLTKVASRNAAVPPEVLPLLVAQAKQRPWKYSDWTSYIRLTHDWDFLLRAHPNPNPNWSVRRIREEYRALRTVEMEAEQERKLRAAIDADVEFTYLPPMLPRGISDSPTGLQATLLTTKRAYVTRGIEEGHCVGTYAEYAAEGGCLVYAIHSRDGASLSTVMFTPVGELLQHYGRFNTDVTDPEVVNFVTITLQSQVRRNTWTY